MGSSEETLSSYDQAIIRCVNTIKKSDNDEWHYRGLELSNGMLCVLVSHPKIDKASAALAVGVGSLANPEHVPGVAHFLEHMLSMGSSKYPGENEYSKMIKSNGGSSNASTLPSQTVYYFDINPDQLSNALDVFAQFFISPLLSQSSLDRELQAVHSEYEGHTFHDSRRNLHIEKLTCDPQHPFSKFGAGNIETLRTIPKLCGIDIRQVLLDFYENEYSANLMSLAVIGNQSLDDLQSLILKTFQGVPNKQFIRRKYHEDPVGETRRKIVCYIVPYTECRFMNIKWVIPDYRELYYCNPATYISFLINHKGVGSLSCYLKKLGLTSKVTCSNEGDISGFDFFTITLELTNEGLERWQEILHIVYQYMVMMRKEGPNERIFRERQTMRNMAFRFDEKGKNDNFAYRLASNMRNYPLSDCLFGAYDMREFRPDLIDELLNKYLIPSKMRIFLIGKTFSTIATDEEKWYGTKYKQEYLSEELIKKCETCDLIPDLYLPLPNDFLPTDFQLLHSQQDVPVLRPSLPRKIKENEFFRLYYAEDAYYKLPKIFLYFNLTTHLASQDPVCVNMTSIYLNLVNDSLSEFTYPAELGGLHYGLSIYEDRITLQISGYNQKIGVLFDLILDRMANFKINPQRFEIIKERRKQYLKNFRRETTSYLALISTCYLMVENQWSPVELLSCIDEITVQAIEAFVPQMFRRFYIDALMYGNLTEDQAINYMTIFQQKFQGQVIFPNMWFENRHLVLPEGCNYAYTMLSDNERMYAINVYLQCFQGTLKNHALLRFFCYLVKENCFHQLRTTEQLGYIVHCAVYWVHSIQGLEIILQTQHELNYVHQRIEQYLYSIRNFFEQMSDDEFRKQRDAFMVKNIEIPKTMYDQANSFWGEILVHEFCFNRSQLENDIIQKLERHDLIRFYNRYISPESDYRKKLTVFVKPTPSSNDEQNDIKLNEHNATINNEPLIKNEIDKHIQSDAALLAKNTDSSEVKIREFEWIDSVAIWKSKLCCYPIVQPHEKVNVPDLYRL